VCGNGRGGGGSKCYTVIKDTVGRSVHREAKESCCGPRSVRQFPIWTLDCAV